MLLAVNIGNTQTVLGVFRGDDLEWQWRLSTEPDRTADEMALLFGGVLGQQGLSFSKEITGVVISSVVPASTQALREMAGRYFGFPPVVVEPGSSRYIRVVMKLPMAVTCAASAALRGSDAGVTPSSARNASNAWSM